MEDYTTLTLAEVNEITKTSRHFKNFVYKEIKDTAERNRNHTFIYIEEIFDRIIDEIANELSTKGFTVKFVADQYFNAGNKYLYIQWDEE